MDAYKQTGIGPAYERAFLPLWSNAMLRSGQEIMARYRRPCLLCAEPTADHCHRRLVAEWWARICPTWRSFTCLGACKESHN